MVWSIVIRLDPGVNPAKELGPRLHGLTRINPRQPKKIKKIYLKF